MRCLAVTTTHPAEKLSAAHRVVTDLTHVGPDDLARLFPSQSA
jgi:hypothetical protein